MSKNQGRPDWENVMSALSCNLTKLEPQIKQQGFNFQPSLESIYLWFMNNTTDLE